MATKTLPQSGRNGMTMQRRHFELIAEIIAKELEGEHREKAALITLVWQKASANCP